MTRDLESRAPHGTSAPGATASGTRPSGTVPDDAWQILEQSLDGEVLRPEDAGYPAASRLFNRRFDDLRPAAVVFVHSTDDVAESLRFARAHGVPVAVRSGGHSYAGWSSGHGRLVIDVRRMNHVTVHPGTALVGAGARLGDVYAALDEHGVTISGGTCPSVGVSGLTLGGGHGLLSRAYGLSCDNLVEATVVTADGTVRACCPETEPDLFWALRGGGNGSFGVVTELRLRTHAVHESSSADLAWPWSRAAEVLAAWQDWAPDLPDEMWSALRLHKDANGPSVSVVAFALGGHDALAERLRELPGERTVDTIRTEPHLDTVRRFAGDTAGPADRPCYDVRSGFFARSLSAEAIGAAITTVENAPAGIDVSMAAVAMGGAVNRRPPHETAFVHRHHRFLGQYEASWDLGGERPASTDAADAAAADAAEQWLGAIYSALWPHSSGEAYQNDVDPRLPDWRHSYYGSATGRLEELKRRYDPDRMFDFPQAL
jgi:FAD/FMN-containing dehydrogenase